MAKTKRISVNVFDRIAKETYTPTETIEWNGIEVIVKRMLSFEEMMMFVDSVVKSCFTIDKGTYLPEVKDFAIKSSILEMYANFSLPNNIEHKYNLIYCTDATQVVLQHIDAHQFNEIVRAINDKLDNIAQANIEMVYKQMNDLYVAFDNLQKQLSSVFEGINHDDVSRLVSAITDNKLDEEKLVKAYTTQVMPRKSD